MIEQGTPVVAVVTDARLFSKTASNIREVKARGAQVICITAGDNVPMAEEFCDHVIPIPAVDPLLRPGLALIPMQLFAYYMAVARGCDVDKPRNLAKSVTVE